MNDADLPFYAGIGFRHERAMHEIEWPVYVVHGDKAATIPARRGACRRPRGSCVVMAFC
jgi:hypothetical protein